MTGMIFIAQFLFFVFLHLYVCFSKVFLKKTHERYINIGFFVIYVVSVALISTEIGDVMLGSAAGWHLRHGIDFYFIDQDHGQYPYFPLMIFLQAGLSLIKEYIPYFTFSFYQKLTLLPAVWYISLVIRQNAEKTYSSIEARRIQLLFISSPIVYAVVLFHGQTDIMAIAFLFAAIIHFDKFVSVKGIILGSLLFAVSVGVKTWPILFILLIIKNLKAWPRIMMFLSIIGLFLFSDIFIYTRLVNGSSFRTVIPAIFSPGGPQGIWGITKILQFYSFYQYSMVIFFTLLLCTGGYLITQKRSIWYQCMQFIVVFYILTPKWGLQYLIWLVPFIYMQSDKIFSIHASRFLSLAACYVAINYVAMYMQPAKMVGQLGQWIGLVLWVYLIWWFFKMIQLKYVNHSSPYA